jgi:hypothetical protein
MDHPESPSVDSQQKTESPSLSHQALSLWAILKSEGKIDTLAARQRGIYHCAGRIKDLRDKNVSIKTYWTESISQTGKITKVGLYVLNHNPQMSLFDIPLVNETPGRIDD